MEKEKPPRRVPRGKGLEWSGEDLDRMAEQDVQDLDEHRAWWEENAPPAFRSLLDAEPDTEVGDDA